MVTKSKLSKILLGLLVGISVSVPFIPKASALDTPYVINGKCVSRLLTFTAQTARPENGVQVKPSMGYVNVYVLNGSDFSYAVQDVSGFLLKSPSQIFYYDYRGSTLIPGNYANYDFAGNTNYLSIGTASKIQDIQYTCNGGAGTVIGSGGLLDYVVKTTIYTPGMSPAFSATGDGIYKKGTTVTVSVPHVAGYVFDYFSGTCNNMSIAPVKNYSTKTQYTYTISNISGNCNLIAQYQKEADFFTSIYHRITLLTSGGGSIVLGGSTSTSQVSQSIRDGDFVTYNAVPSTGFAFSGWSGDLANASQSGSIRSTRDIVATAVFVATSTASTPSSGCGGGTWLFKSSPAGAGYFNNSEDGYYYKKSEMTLTGGTISNQQYHDVPDVCTNGYPLAPTPYSGYEFVGWSADTSIATATLSYLNSTNKLKIGGYSGSYTLTANYQYTGTANDNGNPENEIEEPALVSNNDAVAKYFKIPQGVLARSPYTIDNQCVTRVLTFNANRAVNVFGLMVPISGQHLYTVYVLQGSTFSQNVDGKNITIQSSPSNFIYAHDTRQLTAGSYQSSDTSYFTGTSDSLIFSNVSVVPTLSAAYSCVDPQTAESEATINAQLYSPFYSAPMSQGGMYASPFDPGFHHIPASTGNALYANDYGYGSQYDGSKSIYLYSLLSASNYDTVNCEAQYNTSNQLDAGCMLWLSNHTVWSQLNTDYRYMWVIATKPVKNFTHEQEVDIKETGIICLFTTCNNSAGTSTLRTILAYDPDKKSQLLANKEIYNPITDATSSVDVYLTRINLGNCKKYSSGADYANDAQGALDLFAWVPWNDTACPAVKTPNYMNGLVFDSGESDPAVYIFGIYMTNASTDFSNYSEKDIVQKVLQRVYVTPENLALVSGDCSALSWCKAGYNSGDGVATTPGSKVPGYKSPTYSDPENSGLRATPGYEDGYSSAISDLTARFNSDYDLQECFDFGVTTGLLKGFACVIKNTALNLLATLFIPSSNDLQSFQYQLNSGTSTSFVTAVLTLPLRFQNYSDLAWYPNLDRQIYIGSTFNATPGYSIYTATTTRAGYYTWTATTSPTGYFTATSTYNPGWTETFPGYYDDPVYHATSTASTTVQIVATSTDTSSFTPGAGSQYILAFCGSYCSAPTFNGVSMTELKRQTSPNTNSNMIVYGLATTTTSNKTVTVTAGKHNMFVSLKGLYTATPYGNTAGDSSNSASTLSASISADINDMVFVAGNKLGGNGSTAGLVCDSPLSSQTNGVCNILKTSTGSVSYSMSSFGSTDGETVLIEMNHDPNDTVTPGYYDDPVYHATTTTYHATTTVDATYHATSTVNGYYTYIATSTTSGTYAPMSTTTSMRPYLTVGFSTSTRVDLVPATIGDLVSSKYASADRALSEYLRPLLMFMLFLYFSWKSYKLIFL